MIKRRLSIISVMLCICMFLSCAANCGYCFAAGENGEESWEYEKKELGQETPFRPEDKYVCAENPPVFTWPYVTNATKYDLVVCKDAELTDVKYSKTDLTNNFYSFPNVFETGVNYYWAVRWYSGSKCSEWSNPRRFRISPDAYEFVYPGAEAIMAKVPASHPRIYATKATLEEVRGFKDKSTKSAEIYDTILRVAKGHVEKGEVMPEPKYVHDSDFVVDSANAQVYRNDAFKAQQQMLNCAYAYMLTGDKEIGMFGVKCLLAIAGWDINGDSSYTSQDQVHREVALNCSIGYDLLYDLMSDAEKKTVTDMVVERTKIMEYLLEALLKSPYDSHGWTAYGFIGVIALALYGEVPEAAGWLKKVIDGYCAFLPPWSYEDGGWSQGTDYWQYSTNTNKDFIEILALADIIDFNQKAWSKNEYLWSLYAYPPGSYGSFGDQSNRSMSGSYSLQTSSRQLAFDRNNRVLKWLTEGWGGTSALSSDMIGYYAAAKTESIEPEVPLTYPLAHEFNDIGWIVMTNDLISSDRIQATFKSSPYGSYNHSHADQNSFIIQAYGENLAIKSGYYDAYHSTHDSGFTRKTGAHNSVSVATAKGQQDDNFKAKGELTGFLNHLDFDIAAGDATEAYQGGLDKFERCMIYLRPDVFVVIDELDAKGTGSAQFEWWLNAEHDITAYEEGTGVRLSEGDAALDATVQYPQKVTTYYNNTFALSDMREYSAGGKYANANVHRRVWFETPKVNRTKMVVTMDVHKADEAARYTDVKYYEDYMKMTFEDGTIVLVNLQSPGTEITTKDGIIFDGAAVAYNDESIMLALGTSLKWGDKQLIQCEKRASVAMGRNELCISSYDDQRVSVDTDNDYISGIEKVTNYDGKEISAAYGITMTEGRLVSDDAQEEEERTYFVQPEKEAVTFTLDKDNYTLMLNGKLSHMTSSDAKLRVNVDGQESEYAMNGAVKRDGTCEYRTNLTLDDEKYRIKSMSDGLDFDGCGVGDMLTIKNLPVKAFAEESLVELEKVEKIQVNTEYESDYDSIKAKAAVVKEAEDYDGKIAQNAEVYTTRSFLSGGAGVQKFNDVGTVMNYTIDIKEAGVYDFAVKYVAWEDVNDMENPNAKAIRSFELNGNDYLFEVKRLSTGFGSEPGQWNAAVTDSGIELEPGTYTLKLEPVSGLWNFDWIALIKR